jgi:hypothetical protein
MPAVGALCSETTLRNAASWLSAAATCNNAGRRLPNYLEVFNALNVMSANLQQTYTEVWSNELTTDGLTVVTPHIRIHGILVGQTANMNDQVQYFCVASPS